MKHIPKYKILIIIFLFSGVAFSCKKILEVENPYSKVPRDVVFNDDATAITAITGIYGKMMIDGQNFASGSQNSVSAIVGMSADDFSNYLEYNTELIQLDKYAILPVNSLVGNLWKTCYQTIYQANSAIESLNASNSLTASVKNQLLGESLFTRAFTYFYLVNLFGDVPLVISTDYRQNTNLPRTPAYIVYSQIVDDLRNAQELLIQAYPTAGRVRPNRGAATALLARVYLYLQDWPNAEIQSTALINSAEYLLEGDLNKVFLTTSTEAIWQLHPISSTINTWEGNTFILIDIPSTGFLSRDIVDSFETDDQRAVSWVQSINAEDTTFFYPFKYKIREGGPELLEYSMVLRLAEQYLIRSEARTHQHDLTGAIADLDVIRNRASIPLVADNNPSISENELLLAIERERRCELFTEWGHRWFDLKRTQRATSVLGTSNGNWSSTDTLYPIPAEELLSNPRMGGQNDGY